MRWFRSYVSGRTQKVVMNGISSDAANIGAGVPQGSILGLLLFLFFINDIVLDIRSNIILFADDTTIYMIVDEAYRAAEILNSDMEQIQQWSDQWLVNLNQRKTETKVISIFFLSNPTILQSI